jgi:SAM-dependent methyltransferase
VDPASTAGHEVPPYRQFAPFYDRVIGDAAAPVIARCFERSRHRYDLRFSSAADIGCGTGTFLRHLAQFCDVLYGVDRSAAMLAQARRKLAGANVYLFQQDLRRLRLPRPVDLITCMFDTLNYLTTTAGVQEALESARQNLHDGGSLVFDVITGAGEVGRARRLRQRISLPEQLAIWRLRTDGSQHRSCVEMLWRSSCQPGNAKTWREVHHQRWYPLPWLCTVLNRCGLQVCGVHDVVSYEPASPRTWWAHFVARRCC